MPTTHRAGSSAAARQNSVTDPPGVGLWRSYRVGSRWTTFDEPAYTAVDGTQVAARRLLTQIRYPLAGRPSTTTRPAKGPFPMIVFAPGFMQCGGPYTRMLRSWASAGYVVAAVNFPVTSCLARGPESDLVNQPRDMAFVIRQMLGISGSGHGALAGLVDPAQIAVAGHSDGGDTVAALVGNTCCLDHKVAAAIVLAGGEWPAMRGTYFPAGTPPMLFVQGSADPINPPSASLQMYRADTGTRFYLNLYGASHLPPYEGSQPPEPTVARVTTEFLNRYVAGQSAAGAVMARAGNVPGTAQLVHGGRLPS